jgi:hypothetical protein
MSAETPEETVEVVIQATERVEYFQTVRMPKAEFEKLDKMLESEKRDECEKAVQKIQGWVNTRDVCSARGFELEDFRRKQPAA